MRVSEKHEIKAYFASCGIDARGVRASVARVLRECPDKLPAIREAIASGRIDGSRYDGDCRCLLGTIEGLGGPTVEELFRVDTDAAELFFYKIHAGDTPETSAFSKQALAWVDQHLGATC